MAAHSQLTVAAILVAGGSGERLGAGVPKAFVPFAGRTLLEFALERFVEHPDVGQVVVVAPPSHLELAGRLADEDAVPGGATRQASVAAGLAAVRAEADLVLVHDVARPLVAPSVIDAVLAALRAGADAAVPVLPIADTLRRVHADGALAGVVDRDQLVRVQTPQGFRRAVLAEAHARGAELAVTDDAALVEALGREVVAVPGDEAAFKVTTGVDLVCAEALARLPSPQPPAHHPGGTP